MMAVITFIAKFSFVWLLVLSQHSINAQSFQCGVSYKGKGRLDYNGKETERIEHPWKVALFDVSKGQKYFCGGVLINDETVLTAAHCLDRPGEWIMKPGDISVLLGAHNIDQSNEAGRNIFSVDEIHIHDKWNSSSLKFNNDVALIKLGETVNFNEFIQPVCLPTAEILNINYGTVVGWRVYDDDSSKTSNFPRDLEVPILNASDCVKKDQISLDIFVDETMFCAGKENIEVCPAESGSGFYVEKDGRFYVRGVVSSEAATSCSKISEINYFLYSDISRNLKFIEKNIINEEVDAHCSFSWRTGDYTCDIENLNINRPNFRIGRINTQHKKVKSDQVVRAIRIQNSNLTYLPTFQNGYLKKKFINAKKLTIDGKYGNISLDFAQKSIVPEHIEEFEVIYFGDRLTHLPADMLRGALKLRIFQASVNNIGEIAEDFFSKNVELEIVKLGNNSIKSMPESLWENNLKISEINICDNLLKSLPQNFLNKLAELTKFDASQNRIELIPENFFQNNEKLELVYLFDNKITLFYENLFANNRNLKSLRIENNKITSLPSNLIANSPLLESFDARGNAIKTEPVIFRRNNPKLKYFFI